MKCNYLLIILFIIWQSSFAKECLPAAIDQWSTIIVFEYLDNELSRAKILKNEGENALNQMELVSLQKRFAAELSKFKEVAIVYSLKVTEGKVTTMESRVTAEVGKNLRRLLNLLEKPTVHKSAPR